MTHRTETCVFFDFDDTLSDLIPFSSAYSREIGGVLAAQYSGAPADWGEAATNTLRDVEIEYQELFVGSPLNGYCEWLKALRSRAVEQLFGAMGLGCPPDPETVYRETQHRALIRCDATFVGTREAIRALASAGWRLHAASGQESEFLLGALTGAGLEPYFDRRFGPDLVDCAKEGPEYHTRVFAQMGIDPKDAVVVDDLPLPVAWAVEAGAIVIQAKLSAVSRYETMPGVAAVLTDMRDLPSILERVARR